MIICHCNGVTDRAIRKVVRDGAQSVREVGAACGAATCCGGCSDAVRQVMHAESASRDERPVSAPPVATSIL